MSADDLTPRDSTSPARPHLILIGPMGAGKTTIGKRLARALGLPFVDLDACIERECGAAIPLIFDLEGEVGFREREHRALAEVLQGAPMVLATGGGAILRADNRALMRAHGYVVHLDIDESRQWERLKRDRSRPLLKTADPRGRLAELKRVRDPIYRELADLGCPVGEDSASRFTQRLLALIAPHWQPPTSIKPMSAAG